MLADVKIEMLRDVPVARIVGEVDASNAGSLTERVLDCVPNHAMGLVIDFSQTAYLDSSGVQMLFEVADRLRRRQQALSLVVAPDSFIGDVLDAVSLGEAAARETVLADAVAALAARP